MSELALQLIAKAKHTNAKVLDLGNCGLTELPDELFELTTLEELNVSNRYWNYELNKWIKSENKGKLNQLKRLKNGIRQLTALKTLRINGDHESWFRISDIAAVEKLTSLQTLDLSSNQISDNSFLKKLTNLQTLYLRLNQISNISFLEKLTGLQTLDLSDNQISDISFLEKLTDLQTLDLNFNQISDIAALEKLTALQTLGLRFNQISDIAALEKLTALQTLDLSYNQISDSSFLEKLTNLQTLYLRLNQISNIPFLEKLTGLQTLNLSDNQISDISFLEKLTDLQTLDLSDNKISDITPIKHLIENGVPVVWKNDYNESVVLGGNPLKSPSPEIIKQGNQAILNWFNANKKALNELKLILIGDPQAGKTSILRRLIDDTFIDGEEQTDGINIESLVFKDLETFNNYPSLQEVTAHCWDFGGQETMNATHQFFMTKRCVYILVLHAREDNNVAQQIKKWVSRITATGGNSSIIVLANQKDVNPGFGFVNEEELKVEFPQIKHFLKTSCKNGDEIEELKEYLAELIPQAELFNTKIDERWFPVKEQLQKEIGKDDFLNESRFRNICVEKEIPKKEDQKELIHFLNDLGIVLHFDNKDLAEYFVLDPYWLTYGIYQIITSKHVGNNYGIISIDDLEYIINEEEDKTKAYKVSKYRKIEYSTNERRYLLDFLVEYKLAFKSNCGTKVIIPDVLTTKEPIEVTHQIKEAEDKIQFVYSYPYLPKSILPNFMADTNAMLKEDFWRTGFVLRNGTETALISAYDNRITITVTGIHKQKREFLAVVRNYLEKINNNQNQKPDRLIPLPGHNYEYADYDELIDKERDGDKHHRIYKPVKEKFEISALLEGIPTDSELRSIDEKLDRIIDGMESIHKSLEQNMQKIIADIDQNFDELNQTQSQQAEQLIEFVKVHLEKSNDPQKESTLGQLNGSLSASAKLKLTIPLIPGLLKYETDLKFESKQGPIKSWKDVWHVFFKEK